MDAVHNANEPWSARSLVDDRGSTSNRGSKEHQPQPEGPPPRRKAKGAEPFSRALTVLAQTKEENRPLAAQSQSKLGPQSSRAELPRLGGGVEEEPPPPTTIPLPPLPLPKEPPRSTDGASCPKICPCLPLPLPG